MSMRGVDFMELPEHLIDAVFLNLPVKTLTRFRSLSKAWNNTLQSPAFTKRHLNRSSKTNHIYLHLYPSQFKGTDKEVHYIITENTISCSEAVQSLPPPISTFRFHIPLQHSLARYVTISTSSCHGMFAYLIIYTNTNPIIKVWNPAICRARYVLCPLRRLVLAEENFIGFYYHQADDDYKIVVIERYISEGRMHIMSLKSDMSNNLWRTKDTYYCGKRDSNSVTLDGYIYWISYIESPNLIKHNCWFFDSLPTGKCRVILKFNASEESLTMLPLPPEKYPFSYMQLGQLKGSLCLFFYTNYNEPSEQWAKIWTLAEDYDGKENWSTLMEVPFFKKFGSIQTGHQTPCGFTVSGDLVIKTWQGIFIYIARENRFVQFNVGNHNAVKTVNLSHTETLISP